MQSYAATNVKMRRTGFGLNALANQVAAAFDHQYMRTSDQPTSMQCAMQKCRFSRGFNVPAALEAATRGPH